MRRVALALVLTAAVAAPARAADPVLVAVGDMACDPGSANFNGGNGTLTPAPGACHHKYTSDLALGANLVLALGDLQYEDGVLSKFNASYEPTWGRVKGITRPVPGNHEYGAGTSANGWLRIDTEATGYFTYFEDQLAPFGAAASDPRKGWYSYDVQAGSASWHVVALNSECAAGLRGDPGMEWEGGCDPGSAQEQWLRADLAADTSDCTLAYWHHPLFATGGSGPSPQVKPLWDALYADYADIVLEGHRHGYERFAPQDGGGVGRPGRGVRSWVVGTGGKDLHAFTLPPLATTELRNAATHGVLKLTLHGPGPGHPNGWYQWQFLNDGMSGSTFSDSGSGDCVEPPRPAVAKPATFATVVDRLAPRLSRVRLRRTRFRVGPGTVIGFTLSEAATATFRVDRRRRGRHRRVGTFKRKAAKGRKRVRFSGRIGKRRLRPGLYRLTLTLTDQAGNKSKPRRLLFRILK